MATERDWAAYRTAVVDVVPRDRPALRIVPDAPGTVGTWPDGLAEPLVVVTAWNPDSVQLADDVNAARHRILTRELATRGLTWWPATGRDPDDGHAEEGAAVTGLPEDQRRWHWATATARPPSTCGHRAHGRSCPVPGTGARPSDGGSPDRRTARLNPDGRADGRAVDGDPRPRPDTPHVRWRATP